MRNLLRAAAEALANLSEKAHEWADRAEYWDAGVDGSEAAVGSAKEVVRVKVSVRRDGVARRGQRWSSVDRFRNAKGLGRVDRCGHATAQPRA